jgi:diguanylate cyclase (GGDEF)-like protein
MTGASYILAINLFIAAIFALAFLVVGITNRADRVAPMFALAYLFGLFYIITEFILPLQAHPQFAYTLGYATFLAAMVAVTIGMSRRYGRRLSPTLVGAFVVVSVVANWFGYQFAHGSIERNLVYQVPYALLQAVTGWIVVASKRRQPVDIALIALFWLSALQFLSKPFAAVLLGGSGDSARTYIATTYALYSQSLGAMLGIGTGLLMLTLLVRDLLVEVTARSETDPLSGVYNRRGFDDRAAPGLQRAGVPSAMVLADLDAFKVINDTYGHDTGDQVIVAFSRLLAQSVPEDAVVGRLGGEEFAIFLPDTNLTSARLLAESLRAGFSALQIPALPDTARCTASFGVAERGADEGLADLRRRADVALFAAKRGGRDRVAVAADSSSDSMPTHPMRGTTFSRSA